MTAASPPTARTWILTVPILLSSANDHVVNGRHAAAAAIYRKRRDRWAGAIAVLARAHEVPTFEALLVGAQLSSGTSRPPAFRTVTIERLWPKGGRAWDSDNLVAACKGLRDACQRGRFVTVRGVRRWITGAGLVWDDSPRWSAWHYAQSKAAGGVGGVRIAITEEQ